MDIPGAGFSEKEQGIASLEDVRDVLFQCLLFDTIKCVEGVLYADLCTIYCLKENQYSCSYHIRQSSSNNSMLSENAIAESKPSPSLNHCRRTKPNLPASATITTLSKDRQEEILEKKKYFISRCEDAFA